MLPPLQRFNKFYYMRDKTTDEVRAVVDQMLKDYADWNVKIDIQWDTLERRTASGSVE